MNQLVDLIAQLLIMLWVEYPTWTKRMAFKGLLLHQSISQVMKFLNFFPTFAFSLLGKQFTLDLLLLQTRFESTTNIGFFTNEFVFENQWMFDIYFWLQFFSSNGFPCSSLHSPSDHFVKTINKDFERVSRALIVKLLASNWFHSLIFSTNCFSFQLALLTD